MALDPVTGLLNLGTSIIDKIFPDKTEAEKAKLELLRLHQAGELEALNAQVRSIVAESSGNWLQRSWRPILMLSIVSIVVNNYILVPYLSCIWPNAITVLELPDRLWSLLTLGVGGYVVGRSGEKIVEKLKG